MKKKKNKDQELDINYCDEYLLKKINNHLFLNLINTKINKNNFFVFNFKIKI